MGFSRLALVVVSTLGMTAPVLAQGDIDMEGDQPAPPDGGSAPAGGDAKAPAEGQGEGEVVVKDPKVAKKWLQAAQTLVQKGDQLTKQGKTDEAKINYENAATAYIKSIEAGDDLSLYLPLAIALDKAGDSPGAMTQLKKLLATQGLKADLQKKAQTKLDELSMKVGVVTLTVEPEGTAISIGGKAIGEAPLPEPLVLMPGNHVVSFAAVGYQPKDVELKIEAGSESERKITLDPVPIVTKVSEDDGDVVDTAPVTAPRKPNMLPLYIGGGATLGLAMLATVTGIMAVGKHGDYSDATDPVERADLRSSGKSLALVTDLALVGAIGAAAFTTYWYMYKYRPEAKALEERQAQGPKVDVVPWVQLDGGGFAAVGSF